MLFYEGVNVAHTFFFEDFVDGNENASLFDLAKFMVDGGAEHAHRGAQTHIRIDKWWNVVAQFAHLSVEDEVVFFECRAGEECVELVSAGLDDKGMFGPDKALFVAKVLFEEIEYHVSGLGIERGIHRHLAKEIFQPGYDHRERAQTVPKVVEGKEALAQAAGALVFKRDK